MSLIVLLTFVAVCIAYFSFFLAYDPERHGRPWHRHMKDVVCDCDGTSFEEYQRAAGRNRRKRAEKINERIDRLRAELEELS